MSIFQALQESEYFVAFNPYRKETGEVGSLFVQQEIAMAALLEIPILYFYGKGVSKTIGVSGGLHLNGICVENPEDMKKFLDDGVKKWDSTSKNQLFLEFNNPHFNSRLLNHPNQPLSNWYHLVVKNGSTYKHARNCRAYVEKIENLTSNEVLPLDYKLELIWAGTGTHSISLTKRSKRDVDAIWTIQGSGIWRFQSLQTSTVYVYPNLNNGQYRMTYSVLSDNFPDAIIEVELNFLNDKAVVIRQKKT